MSTPHTSSPSFLEEVQDTWRRLPDKAIFGGLLVGWLALFQAYGLSTLAWTGNYSLFSRLWGLYSAPDSTIEHAKIVPLAIIALLWHKRSELAAIPLSARWPGLVLFTVAIGLHLLGFLAQQESISTVALFLGLYSLVGLAWGWRVMRETFFPFVLFAFCVPLGPLMATFTFWLQMVATALTAFVSHDVLGVPLRLQGTSLIKPDGSAFEVIGACSGLHSFMALLLITLVYAMVALRKGWKRAMMIGVSIPLAIGCNVVRLVSIVIADKAFGSRASAVAHESDWIITYGVALLSLMALSHWLSEKESPVAA